MSYRKHLIIRIWYFCITLVLALDTDRKSMFRIFVLFLLVSSSAWSMSFEMKDAIVHVELHDRSGRVTYGKGMFVSGIGEFAVLKSIMNPALKDPYDYLLSFKTADDRPLTDIQFSFCEKVDENPYCFYKANYIPYRKVDLGNKESTPENQSKLYSISGANSVDLSEVEPSNQSGKYWSLPKTSNGSLPGTILIDQEKGEAKAVVTSNRRGKFYEVIPIHRSIDGLGSKSYAPIEQQSSNTIPKHLHENEKNMLRMVADVNKMSDEQIKKIIEELFVPGGGARSQLKKRSDNNRLSNNAKEEVALQASARGDEARRDFFKVEQDAEEAKQEAADQAEELGKLEKRLEGKEAIYDAIQMKAEGLKEELIESSVKLEVSGQSLSEEDRSALEKRVAKGKGALEISEKKAAGLVDQIGKLKAQIAALKKGLGMSQKLAKELGEKARGAAKKNADAIQGSRNYKGDLL